MTAPRVDFEKPIGSKKTFKLGDDLQFSMMFVPGVLAVPAFYPYNNWYDKGEWHREEILVRKEGRSCWMGETEVTVKLWLTVVSWAEENGYVFSPSVDRLKKLDTDRYGNIAANYISWRDAILFCNALTEYINEKAGLALSCYYFTDEEMQYPLKKVDSSEEIAFFTDYSPSGSQDDPFVNDSSTGFRVPSIYDWMAAARFKRDINKDGDIVDPGEYYADDVASGGSIDSPDDRRKYTSFFSGTQSAKVGQKLPNALGLYDMTGNVAEVFQLVWNPERLESKTGKISCRVNNRYEWF